MGGRTDAWVDGRTGQRHEKQALFDTLVSRADRFLVITDETEGFTQFPFLSQMLDPHLPILPSWMRTCLSDALPSGLSHLERCGVRCMRLTTLSHDSMDLLAASWLFSHSTTRAPVVCLWAAKLWRWSCVQELSLNSCSLASAEILVLSPPW